MGKSTLVNGLLGFESQQTGGIREDDSAPHCGSLSLRRLTSYQKLNREQAMNSATLVEKRSKDKALGKLINNTQSAAKRFKKGY